MLSVQISPYEEQSPIYILLPRQHHCTGEIPGQQSKQWDVVYTYWFNLISFRYSWEGTFGKL